MTKHPAPAHLPPEAAAVWDEVVAKHADAGDTTIERKLGRLESYAVVVAIQRTAAARALKYGDTIQDARGTPVRNPAVDIVNDQNRELARWGDLFEPKTPRPRRGTR